MAVTAETLLVRVNTTSDTSLYWHINNDGHTKCTGATIGNYKHEFKAFGQFSPEDVASLCVYCLGKKPATGGKKQYFRRKQASDADFNRKLYGGRGNST